MHQAAMRTAVLDDFDDIFLLLQQLWPTKESNKNAMMSVFTCGLDSNQDWYFCAEINGMVIGFCSLTIKNGFRQEGCTGYINELVVDNSVRGQGIGTDLLKVALNTAKEKGCKGIELDSAFHREETHKFYERIGFEKRVYLFSKEL